MLGPLPQGRAEPGGGIVKTPSKVKYFFTSSRHSFTAVRKKERSQVALIKCASAIFSDWKEINVRINNNYSAKFVY